MKERSDGFSVILFRVRVIVVINEVRCRRRFLAIQFTEGLRQAACARRGTQREREREREKGRVRVWGRLSGPEVLVFVPSPTFA
jgi:hypothetical protein